MSITSSSFNFKDTFINSKDGNIKGSTTEIEDKYISFTFSIFIKTVSNGSSSWFIDDSSNSKTSNLTSIFCSLTLVIVEISWDSNNSILDGLIKMGFSNFSHFGKNH